MEPIGYTFDFKGILDPKPLSYHNSLCEKHLCAHTHILIHVIIHMPWNWKYETFVLTEYCGKPWNTEQSSAWPRETSTRHGCQQITGCYLSWCGEPMSHLLEYCCCFHTWYKLYIIKFLLHMAQNAWSFIFSVNPWLFREVFLSLFLLYLMHNIIFQLFQSYWYFNMKNHFVYCYFPVFLLCICSFLFRYFYSCLHYFFIPLLLFGMHCNIILL